jgi:hypothetical protein
VIGHPISLSRILIAPAAVANTGVRPFVAGSLAQIQTARQGKPFILDFWSVAWARIAWRSSRRLAN